MAGTLHAGTIPKNLGSGLEELVADNLQQKTAQKNGTAAALKSFNGYATKKADNISHLMMADETGRVLVRVQLNGIVPLAELEKSFAAKVPNMKVQAKNTTYHGAGVFEAFVSLDDVPKLAAMEGVSSVLLTPKPIHARMPKRTNVTASQNGPAVGETLREIGTVFDFGVTQHCVDQINKTYNPNATLDYEGAGINIGDLSDSYNNTTSTTAAKDVSTGDLPGAGNTVNSQPVVVLQDYTSGGTDEGRAMLQTIFKMAPKAQLAFATADFGELQFADNIRSLAGLARTAGDPLPNGSPTFKADIIVDDVSYLDEPFFQDGIIAQGVNDVVNAGVSYFSSAANNPPTNGYDADFNFVPNGTGMTAAAGNTALAGTNINLANVPAAAYAGGFHNFNPAGLDVAQTINFPNAAQLANYGNIVIPGQEGGLPVVLQWNDPDDTTTPSYNPTPIYTQTGSASAVASASFTEALTAGQEYYFKLVPSATALLPGTTPLDGQVTISDASGNELSFTDNNGSGANEYVFFFPPTTGSYTIKITAYQNAAAMDVTSGNFTLYTYTANGTDEVTQNLNLLVFDMSGSYIAADSITTNGIASNSPIKFTEFAAPTGANQVQFVISRSNQQPTAGRAANHFRYICFGDGIVPLGPAEYFSYLTPLTFGHSCAAGANGVAAYPYYKPNIPEFFTSPGPTTIYFDANNNALSTPEVRLKPDIAAMDGANTTFFGSDDDEDQDSNDNFFGTSDAAPHAAAIAALVLQANGGGRNSSGVASVTPAQMKSVLQRSAFEHDLDPYYARGTARTSDGEKVNIIVKGDNEDSQLTTALANGTAGIQDPNAITVQYIGSHNLSTLVFNPTGAIGSSGNTTDGTNGLTTAGVYFNNPTPGTEFDTSDKAFTLGTSSPSLTTTTVTSAVSNSNFTLKLTFTAGAFAGGDILRFTIGRDEYESADTGQTESVADGSADVIGGGVTIPDGVVNTGGMTFNGTTSTGATFSGVITNRLGSGYSVLDGFGFINAQKAVSLPLQ